MTIRLKRAYDAPTRTDGYRVLVDRVWPRGVSKDKLSVDDWAKEVAPSARLRKWFGHDPAKWDQFKERYFRELDERSDAVEPLREMASKRIVTLVFGAKNTRFNNAVALKEYLEQRVARSARSREG